MSSYHGAGNTYYTLIEVHEPSYEERLMYKAGRSLSCAMSCLLSAWFMIAIASYSPLWAVSSLTGRGEVFLVEYSVDFHVGSGIWMKNVCFGSSIPKEDVLRNFGLTCEGTSVLDKCEFDDNGKELNNNVECERLKSTQLLTVFASFCALLGLVSGCCANPGSTFRVTFAAIFAAITWLSSISVLYLMRDTNMMNQEWGCITVLGADLCKSPGPSAVLQGLGVLFAAFAFCSFLSSAMFARSARNHAFIHQAVVSSRQQVPTGIVVV